MKKIGITGNIGSGKTTVCKIFEHLQVPIFYADTEAKKLYDRKDIRQSMINMFGKGIYKSDGKIDTLALASKIFNNEDQAVFVSGLLYPALRKVYDDWLITVQSKPYILYEAAILFETGFYKSFDAIIVVEAPLLIRLHRIQDRDQLSETKIRERMDRQWRDERKSAAADYLIRNDGKSFLIPQVLKLHKSFTESVIMT